MKQNKKWMFLFLLAATTAACIDNPIDPGFQNARNITQETPELDETEFLSADPNAYQEEYREQNNEYQNNGSTTGQASDDAEDRVAEEGDIYRVSSSAGIILNLNPYRGLQLIDFSDPTAPKIIGQAQISGEPVEMYQVGNFVYILMNNWWGYYANQVLGLTDRYNGGVIAVVDITDQTKPVIIERAQVEGSIQTSRLTRGNDKESLYVASSKDGSAYVKSFSLSETGDLIAKDEIELGGYVLDIQATGTHLLVSREAYDEGQQDYDAGSDIAVIDISDENGVMVEGATVSVQGLVQKKTDMSFQDNILRVVSGNSWSSNTNTNHVETFNYSDLQNPTAVDAKTFGQGEDLFATLFLKNAAFFVTFEQVDPFHTFSISDTGALVEESEFIVSGFNTWFRPVSDNTRLIGIGVDDKNGNRSPAVSLYDIEDLKNANPLVDREEVTSSWSDAIWDDKSFSVLEKSANVMSDTGVLETGIVLLPFQGWDNASGTYRTGVQIFTFSDTTLSKRGVMLHDTPVTRTFAADRSKDLTGNLSNLELSLYNTADVDAPTEVSRLALAPDFTKVLVFGEHLARRIDKGAYWSWWRGNNITTEIFDTIEIVLKSEVTFAPAIAEIMIPANSILHKKDDLLIVIAQDSEATTIIVWDFSDPISPVLKDTLTTNAIPTPVINYYDDYYEDCYDCYGEEYAQTPSAIVGNAIVFQADKSINTTIGTVYTSYESEYTYNDECDSYEDVCTYVSGERICKYLKMTDGTVFPTSCETYFDSCTQDSMGNQECISIPAPSNLTITTDENVASSTRKQRSFHIVDISNADDIKLRDTIVSGANEDVERTLKEGDLFHLSFNTPLPITHPTRNFAVHYFRTFDFTDPANVVVSNNINIPGRLIAADGNNLITKGLLWSAGGADQTLNRLELVAGRAHLRGIERFDQYNLDKVELGDDNQLYVTYYDNETHLAVYPMTGTFTSISDIELEGWLTFEDIANGRAIFTVEGGILIVNMDDLNNPYVQAFLPMRSGWSIDFLLEGNELFIAAGLYGMYQFDITTSNLPTP